jgi:YidC/Oxa1 family membrane protein insertase
MILASLSVSVVSIAALFAKVLLFSNPFSDMFDSLAHLIAQGLDYINGLTHNYGWSMLVLAVVVRVVLMPLFMQQYKAMKEMQALAPYVKRLQTKYPDKKNAESQRKLQEETMALYRQHNVNPLGGCLPVLAQMPVLIAVYRAIWLHNDQFKGATWLWIGSPLSHQFPQVFANNLFEPDKVLMFLYAVSMYFSMRLTPTTGDPQQQQMMRTQSIIMPFFLFGLGLVYKWSSGFILYWLGFNLVSMVQQYLIARAPSRIGKLPAETPATLAGYPLDCPSCGAQLVVVKGSKCEKCRAKVRKLQPGGNGAANVPALTSTKANGEQTGGGAKKGS